MDGAPAISATGVSKRYGSVEALNDVTVAMDGVATGLLGANGAGKSTLMRALLGLVRPDAGTLTILGLDAARDSRDIRRRVGYMPEGECLPRDPSAHVFVVHLAELRGLPRRAAVLRASEVLFQVGLEEERSRPIGTFSTGMRQRVKLAQALVLLDRVLDRAQPAHPGRRPAERPDSRLGVGPEVPQPLPERPAAHRARLEIRFELLALTAFPGRLRPRRALPHDLP